MINNSESIYALLIVARVMSNLVCYMVLEHAIELQQLVATTRALQQTADHLDRMYFAEPLPAALEAYHTAGHAHPIGQLFIVRNHHLGKYKHSPEYYMWQMLRLTAVACLFVVLMAVVLVSCPASPVTERITTDQATDDRPPEPQLPHRCTWCPDTHCCPCCPEYRWPKPSCRSCPHSSCCRCCPAPGCPCCSNPDCCNSLGCNCRESHCCVTQGCLRHSNPMG